MPFPNQVLKKRLEKVQQKLFEEKLDGLLISSQQNRYYLTGWRGDSESGYLLITPKKAFLITDSRYTEEAASEAHHFEVREYGYDKKFWEKLFSENKLNRVGYEVESLSVFDLKKLQKLIRKRLVAIDNFVEQFRAEKDGEEIKLIRRSAEICDQTFRYILANIKPGQTEKQIAWEMEKFMRENGAERNAWDPFIVASGANSSKVHYAAGSQKLKKGDQVLVDWGCYFEGYASDIS